MKNSNKKYGFTLMELMVAVIIIAVLAAVAVPQYKKAVIKSRFSKVMPVAKSIADAQEVYYLGQGAYALGTDKLDVEPITGGEITVALSETDGYDYVMTQSSKVPGTHYIMYQKHSENYPDEIHCEAEDENEKSQWLCKMLSNNNSIGKTVTDGYTTYIINGGGVGFPVGYNALLERVDCTGAEAMGFTCEQIVDEENNTASKRICTMTSTGNICRTRTYNEDGSYTSVTCTAAASGQCSNEANNWRSATYDENGNKISIRRCAKLTAGICTEYTSSGAVDYTYDANGNQLTLRNCSSVDNNGNCTAYSTGADYTYDANGNMLTERYCNSMDSNGNCTAYYSTYNYTYDANGNMLTMYNDGEQWYYTYDANGNKLTSRLCASTNTDGSCRSYKQGYEHYDYTYDADGRILSQRICTKVNADGSCTSYRPYVENYDFTYDGNIQTVKQCSTMNADGSCSGYTRPSESAMHIYDDNGKELVSMSCNTSNFNSATGGCYYYTLEGYNSMIAN